MQRALDEVGEETAGILQRAHETADEIAARSRAQAEGRIQRAEREADMLRQQADSYAEQLVLDTRMLWAERQRLIQDIRQLADEVLATAEDASERVTLPQMLAEPEPATEPAPTERCRDRAGPDTEPVAAPTKRTRPRARSRPPEQLAPGAERLERQLAAGLAARGGALVRGLARGAEGLREQAARSARAPCRRRAGRPRGCGPRPAAGARDRRGMRKASTSRTMQTATMMAMVM